MGLELFPKSRRLLRIIIFLLLAFPAVRTYVTHNTYGKQARVQDLSFVNFHATLSYFLGRVLPAKMTAQAQASDHYSFELPKITEHQPQRQVVLIIGESLSMSRMGLYNSTKQTTPQLNSLRDSGQVITRMGVSGGVSTDVSVPMLIHSTFGLDASKIISAQKSCLFRLARQNGFITDFVSIQTPENLQHITNFLCPSYIEHFKTGEPPSREGGESVELDEKLLTSLQEMDWKKPHFIVLQQRGSHSPYENRYPSEGAQFPITNEDPNEVKQSKHYENSVYYTDQVISKAVALIEKSSPLPAEIIFTSDHGEALGENGQWGHGLLDPYVAEVPILYFSRNLALRKQFDQAPKWIDHYYVTNFVRLLLGYQSELPSTNASSSPSSRPSFTVLGLDLDGLDGYMQVVPSGDKLLRVKNSP
ncbi:MAG: phosphoethanolamine transferase [Pseudomonadota bacterium]